MQSNGTSHKGMNGTSNATGEDGLSTESEADSYQEWSDRGWRTSSSNPARPSLSSSDDQSALPSPTSTHPSAGPSSHSRTVSQPSISIPIPPTRAVAFTSSDSHFASPSSISHRRQTVSRPSLHTAGSQMDLDAMTATSAHATLISMGDMSSSSTTQPPPYPEATSSSTYTAYPRARRKSLSHISPAAPRLDEETSPDELYHANGLNGVNGTHGKGGKKKRSRTASFSLPFHRRRRLSNAGWSRWWRILRYSHAKRPYTNRWSCLAILFMGLLCFIYLWRRAYELQVEFSVFSHRWVRDEVDTVSPLRGCFNPPHLSPFYDLEKHRSPHRQLLTPGVSLKRGTQCYDFSATVQPLDDVPLEPLIYHTYWRSDLIPFGERHTATLLAFLATQPLTHSKLILWTNGVDVVANNSFVKPFLDKWGNYIEVRHVDMNFLTKGTELEGILSGNNGGGLFDERAWVDGDAVRLLVLWHYGGIWMDMDQILTRDLHPLTEQEFVTQWDCYDKPYFSLNGALMHFRKHSPYLCEAFHIMASSPLPKPNTFTWGSHLYSKLHRRLLANHQQPFAVLPWCFADPRNCRSDIRFPDPFGPDPEYWGGRRWDGRGEVGRSGKELLQEKVGYIWTIHLHNQWKKDFYKGGWIARLLDGYRRKVDSVERHAKNVAVHAGGSGGTTGTTGAGGHRVAAGVGAGAEGNHPAGAGQGQGKPESGAERGHAAAAAAGRGVEGQGHHHV